MPYIRTHFGLHPICWLHWCRQEAEARLQPLLPACSSPIFASLIDYEEHTTYQARGGVAFSDIFFAKRVLFCARTPAGARDGCNWLAEVLEIKPVVDDVAAQLGYKRFAALPKEEVKTLRPWTKVECLCKAGVTGYEEQELTLFGMFDILKARYTAHCLQLNHFFPFPVAETSS